MELLHRAEDVLHTADVNNHGLTATETRELLKVHRAAILAVEQERATFAEDRVDLARQIR